MSRLNNTETIEVQTVPYPEVQNIIDKYNKIANTNDLKKIPDITLSIKKDIDNLAIPGKNDEIQYMKQLYNGLQLYTSLYCIPENQISNDLSEDSKLHRIQRIAKNSTLEIKELNWEDNSKPELEKASPVRKNQNIEIER